MVQKLNDEGVPANHIVQISGHKNLNSLNNYSKLNNNQAMAISDILSNGKEPTSNPSSSTIPSRSMNDPQYPMSRGFFVNTNFYGNVTFNFDKREQHNLSQQHHEHLHTTPPSSSTYSDENESPVGKPVYKRIRFLSDSDSD